MRRVESQLQNTNMANSSDGPRRFAVGRSEFIKPVPPIATHCDQNGEEPFVF